MAHYKLTGQLIKKHRGKMPKQHVAAAIGIEYRGLVDKLEDGTRRAPLNVEKKLLKVLNINVDEYMRCLMDDYENQLREELEMDKKNIIETHAKIIEEEEWKDLI